MLGNIAKKLRILGYDTTYYSDMDMNRAIMMARKTGRVLITSNRRVRHHNTIFISTHDNAMRRIVRMAGLAVRVSGETARCPICNGETRAAIKDSMSNRVPPKVWEHNDAFWECVICHNVYWEGSHIKRLRVDAVEWA